MAPVQHDLDHAGARLARDLQLRELSLRLLHVFLHLLRLTHQVPESALHHDRCSSVLSISRFDRCGVDLAAEALAQPLDRRIFLEGRRGLRLPVLVGERPAAAPACANRPRTFEGTRMSRPDVGREGLRQLVLDLPVRRWAAAESSRRRSRTPSKEAGTQLRANCRTMPLSFAASTTAGQFAASICSGTGAEAGTAAAIGTGAAAAAGQGLRPPRPVPAAVFAAGAAIRPAGARPDRNRGTRRGVG